MNKKEIRPEDKLYESDQVRGKIIGNFIRFSIPILLLLFLTLGAVHFFQYSVSRRILEAREVSNLKIGYEAIRNDIQTATSDLMHLADCSHMQELIELGSSRSRHLLADDYHSLIKAKKNYDQIRYLDNQGMEIVRVNFNSGMPLTVPDEKLQDKSRRYYFTDTHKLDQYNVFVSPMDLNIENGQIEQPLKPMLRFGTPVFDSQNRKKGVILINYFANTIRHTITQFLRSSDSAPMLLNAQGFWLLAPDPKDEWGFMYKNQRRFSGRYPEVWEKIIEKKSGQMNTDDGIFTFVTVYPLRKGHTSSSGAVEAFSASQSIVDDKMYFWVLVTHVPSSLINAEIYNHMRQGALQWALVSLIILPLVWLFSRERVNRKWALRKLHKNEQYLRTITSQLGEGLLVINRQGNLITMNKEAEHLLGWRSEELVGKNLPTVLTKFPLNKTDSAGDCVVLKAIEDGVSQRMDNIEFTNKRGEPIPVSLSVAPFQHEDTVHGAILTFRDISERLKMQSELKVMATHDPLTGIKNRGEIERLLHIEMNRAKRYHRSLVIMMIDIDHFKNINDTYGHQNGDIVLKTACAKMTDELRDSDVLGRYGGEEFLAILPETALPLAQTIAERLRVSLSELNITADDQTHIRFTVSIGAAAYPESASSAEKLIQIADKLLYKAKESGRNRVITLGGNPPPHLTAISSNK